MSSEPDETTEPRRTAWCCERDATVSIVDPTLRYNLAETHACADHVEALGGGVEGNVVTLLEAPTFAVSDATRGCLYIVSAYSEAAAIQAVQNDQWIEQLDADNVTDATALTAVRYCEVKRIEIADERAAKRDA